MPSIEPETSRRPDEHRQRAAHRVAVDRQGRIWITELSSRRVHVFDSEGRKLFERVPDAEHYRPHRPADWLTVRDDGTLFLCGDGAIESFEPSGERGPRIETGEYLAPRWWFLPTSSRWVIGSARRIDLIDPAGKFQATIERAPDGQELEALVLSAVDVDGTLAVLDQTLDHGERTRSVHLFSAEGRPLRSVSPPPGVDEARAGSLALDRGLLLILAGHQVHCFRASDGILVDLVTLPSGLEKPAFLYFSPSGEELWVFPHMRAEMWRFPRPR